MRLFHPVNSLILRRNLCLFFKENLTVSKLSQTCIRNVQKFLGFQSCAYFSLALVVVEFLANIIIFHYIKVAKHIWEVMLPPGGRNWQLISLH
jgi:hypothetical protein